MTSIAGNELFDRLTSRGFDFFSGVPCSLIKGLLVRLEEQTDVPYLRSVREDEAVGQACGAWMAGKKPVVLMQNSGLGNSLNGIVSLNQIYATPFLLLVTWRGFEGKDAPEHIVMGAAMCKILDAIEMPWDVLDPDRLDAQLATVDGHLAERRPCALIVKKGVVA